MKAIVLSGGGSKGSYQIGVWKAFKKLHFKYDIVTGTSVGALNGALMVQDSYNKAMKLWKHMNMELLFGENATTSNKTKDILNMYRVNFFKHGGMEVKDLENLIDECIDKDKFYNSSTNFGLVTVNVNGKKAIQLKKNKIPSEKLVDYLMASASCYPAFQAKDIDGKKFIDGGMFDNLPINLAASLGATDIIAVDLCAPGFKQRVKNKKNLNIITIKPNNKLTNFLNFNEEGSRRNIIFGYNDTMKVFGKYLGYKYTFKKRNVDSLLVEYSEIFLHNFNNILNNKKLTKIFNLENINITDFLLKTSEDIGIMFNINEEKIYNYKRYNKILLKRINKLLKTNNDKKYSTIIDFFYKMKTNDYKYLRLKGILSPKEFIISLYLYTLSEV